MPAADTLSTTFAAVADPTRRAILARLASGDATVNELAAPFSISLPAISRHLKVLERASLIVRAREGRHRPCRLNPAALEDASAWLAFHLRFWNDSLDRLAEHLRQPRKPKEKGHARARQTRRRGT